MRYTTEAEFELERKVVLEALALYGREVQLSIGMEECAELIVALSHHLRGRVADEKLAEEVADVELICQSIRVLVGHDLVDTLRRGKVTRLANRVAAAALEADDIARLADGDATPTRPVVVGHGDEGANVAEEPAG